MEAVQTALNCYENQKKVHKRYREKNKEKLSESSKNYYYKMKEDPEKYQQYLERCRKKYTPKKQNEEEIV